MVLAEIEKLIEKYENAETTLIEETQLKNYFSQETVAPHLEIYKPIFAYFLDNQTERAMRELPLKTKKTKPLYQWIAVAAIAIIMFGVYVANFGGKRTLDDLNTEERLAYNQAMEAFSLLSSNFNKGTESLAMMSQISESLEMSSEQFSRLEKFDNTIDRLFKIEE